MSDLATAKKAAQQVLDRIKAADTMAPIGTYEHQQFMSATVLMELTRLRFILEVIQKN